MEQQSVMVSNSQLRGDTITGSSDSVYNNDSETTIVSRASAHYRVSARALHFMGSM